MIELYVVGSVVGFIILATAVMIPVVKTLAKIYPYAYTNARLRAMRADLIKEEEFEELLRKPYNEIIYYLEQRSYPNLSKYLETNFTYAAVERALTSNLIRTIGKIKQIAPEQSKPFVQALLGKYDTQLIESMVRTSTAQYEFRRDIFHVTDIFSDNFIAQKNHDIESLHNELKNTIYEPLLVKHLENIKKGQFEAFEQELDLFYYSRLSSKAKTPEAKAYVRLLIDRQNVGLALKKREAMVPGGRIPFKELQGGKEELLSTLQKHNYDVQGETEEAIEQSMYKLLRTKGEKMMQKNPLSEATIIGYLIHKTTNIRALNVLLKMKYHKFTEEQIREVIVY